MTLRSSIARAAGKSSYWVLNKFFLMGGALFPVGSPRKLTRKF